MCISNRNTSGHTRRRLALCVVSIFASLPIFANWVHFRGDGNTGAIASVLSTTDVSVSKIASYPTKYASKNYFLSYGDIVYIVRQNRILHAYDIKTSAKLYSLDLNSYITCSPLIIGNKVLIAVADGYIYSIDRTSGAVINKEKIQNGLVASLNNVNGAVSIQFNNNGIKSSGIFTKYSDNMSSAICYADDNIISWGDDAGQLYIIHGTNQTSAQYPAPIVGTVLKISNTIVSIDENCVLRATDVNAVSLWDNTLDATALPYVAYNAQNDTIIVVSTNGLLYSINRSSGAIVYRMINSFGILTPPTIIGDKIVFGGNDNRLYIFSALNGIQISAISLSANIDSEIVPCANGLVFSLKNGDICNAKCVNTPPEAPNNLLVNGLSAPLTKGMSNVVAWSFIDKDTGDKQSAYQLQLASTSDFTNVEYDSGKVLSPTSSSLVANSLSDGKKYLRVCTWDAFDAKGIFSTGLDYFTVDATAPISSAYIVKNGTTNKAIISNYIASENIQVIISSIDTTNNSVASGVSYCEYSRGTWITYTLPVEINGLSEGAYPISYRSVDNVGNVETTRTITIVKDITAPIITVANITNGGFYKPGIYASIAVVENNIDDILATMDNNPYSSGTPIQSEGLHRLVVTAIDKSGNSARQEINFTIDGTMPVVLITGVSNGGIYQTGIAPVVSITDANLYSSSILLNGNVYASGTPILNGGIYDLVVVATDKANNIVSNAIRFTVDSKAPVIAISGITNGVYYSNTVSPTIRITDDDLAYSSITLNGNAYSSGTFISTDGAYNLTVIAKDLAGNVASNTILFTIDTILPVLAISGVLNNAYYNSNVSVAIHASDINLLTNYSTLDGSSYISGTTIGSEGVHEISSYAIDKAYISTSNSIRFTIDKTAPVVSISGISNGGMYTNPVSATISASDINLKSVTALLDGFQYVSGTIISNTGNHTLVVDATDKASNSTHQSISFSIGDVAPVIVINGAVDGGYYKPTLNIYYSAIDTDLQSVTAKLNNKNYISGDAIWKEGTYTLTVTARDLAGHVVAKTISFIIDGTAPKILVNCVADGEYYTKSVSPQVIIIEKYLSNSTILLNGETYNPKTRITNDGKYVLVAEAIDISGNSNKETVTFYIDRQSPVIFISGVSNGGFYTNAVTPIISITDTNLSYSNISLNCKTYKTGDVITNDGDYILQVFAKDYAGNSSEKKITFSIDNLAPVITISGISQYGYFKAGTCVTISAIDVNLLSVAATLDGNEYLSGTPIKGDGIHSLIVIARDKVGHTAVSKITFTIDGISPIVSITGIEDNGYYNIGVSPNINVIDLNLLSSTILLDDKPYISGAPIYNEGAHTLYGYGVDKAGNFKTKIVKFVVDGTTPTISVSGIENNAVYNRTVTVDVSVSDANLKRTYITLDNVPVSAHVSISGEGEHALHIEAEDKSGNRSMKDVTFAIDKTLPVVLVSGISQNGAYSVANIGIKIFEENYDIGRSTIKLDSDEYTGRVSNSIDENGNRCYFLNIQNISSIGKHSLSYTIYDKAGNSVRNTIVFSITPFDANEQMSFYATYDKTTKATVAKGEHDDYSGVRVVVNGGFVSNCIAPGVTSGDVVAQYRANKNFSSSQGTLSLWLQPSWSNPTSNTIFSIYDSALKYDLFLSYVSKTEGTVFTVKNDKKVITRITSSSNWWKNNEWTCITFTWGTNNIDTSKSIAMYCNGTLLTNAKIANIFDTCHWICIGYGMPDKKWTSFTGKMDEIRIYEKMFNPNEVRSLYESERARLSMQGGKQGQTMNMQANYQNTTDVISEERTGSDMTVGKDDEK